VTQRDPDADTNLMNLNGGLLCACEILTSGNVPRFHDLIQICLLPLNADFKPNKKCLPFYCDLKPRRKDNIDFDNLPKRVTRQQIYDITIKGADPDQAADLLQTWFDKFQLGYGKKIWILAYDWIAKRPFIEDWLQSPTQYNMIFDYRYRDPLPASLYCNDKADFGAARKLPYAKVDFSYLCASVSADPDRSKDCLIKCLQLSELYTKMIKGFY
jgi:hypothetical protein